MNGYDARETLLRGLASGKTHRFTEMARSPRGKPGFQRGNRAGSSMEYKDFREYQAGDDLRHIDWNAYARSDKLIVKRFHEEVTPHLDLIVDGSASMSLAETRKAETATYLAGFFAGVASNTGFSHRVWLTDEVCAPLRGGEGDPRSWAELEMRASRSPAEAVAASRPRWRRGGFRVLISDLLWPADPLGFASGLAQEASALLLVQVLAHVDADPGEGGMHQLIDAESNAAREIRLDGKTRAGYLASFARHQAAWRDAARQVNGAMVTLIDERFLTEPRFDDPAIHQILRG